MKNKSIAGLSLTGGRKDNFFFCLVEFFPDEKRWFLKSVLSVKDEEGMLGDELLGKWALDYNVSNMMVDFPLSSYACAECRLICPGQLECPDTDVVETRSKINTILQADKKLYEMKPKLYEQLRIQDDEINMIKEVFDKETIEPLLSRSFKRKLRRGYIPYWNRPLDLWIWSQYYDPMLDIFNFTYDSFGRSSLMLIHRFAYLKRHFSSQLNFFESNTYICLLELIRAGIVSKKIVCELADLDMVGEARAEIIKFIEKKLNIFIYNNDIEIIVKNPKAFESFLLAVVGQRKLLNDCYDLPKWVKPEDTKFISPRFSM